MDKAFSYDKSFAETNLYKDTVSFWKKSMDSYEAGRYKESLLYFLNYLNPDLVKTKGKNNNTEFLFPHGSLLINFKITNEYYEIKAPFLKIPEKRSVILLRQICELNFSTMNLTQILSDNNELFFYYKSPLANCNPNKMWDLFYEICINGDYYDDKFINELEAERIYVPEIIKYPEDILIEIWIKYHEIIDYGIQGCTEYQLKRIFTTGVDHALITLMKLSYVLAPQGIIRNNISNYYNLDNSQSFEEKLNKLLINLKKMKTIDRTVFEKSIYQTEFLIPVKIRAEIETIQSVLKNDYETAKEDIAVSNFIVAGYYLLFRFYYILYSYNIPKQIEKEITNTICAVSEKDWNEASKILFKLVDKIMKMK